jgi:hypothetical protein
MIDAKDRKYMETENTATADEECIRCLICFMRCFQLQRRLLWRSGYTEWRRTAQLWIIVDDTISIFHTSSCIFAYFCAQLNRDSITMEPDLSIFKDAHES